MHRHHQPATARRARSRLDGNLLILMTAVALVACPSTQPPPRSELDPNKPGIMREIVQYVIHSHDEALRGCYDEGRKREPNLQGEIRVRFFVESDGRVGDVIDVGSDMPDRAVVRCIFAEYRRMTFPPPRSGRETVLYGHVFAPND